MDAIAIAAIKGTIRRGRQRRSDLRYLTYAENTWSWWCRKQRKRFIILRGGRWPPRVESAPPTVKRWFAAREMLLAARENFRMALVDADTMVRWDAPDFLRLAGDRIGAVRGKSRHWIRGSIQAFQDFFPRVRLTETRYFNAGMVVLGRRHLPLLDAFCDFYVSQGPALEKVFRSGNFGTDQTILNFIARRDGVEVGFLPGRFNLLYCFDFLPAVRNRYEFGAKPDWTKFAVDAFDRPAAFSFVEKAFVWHFNNTLKSRRRVMAETWRRVAPHYGTTRSQHLYIGINPQADVKLR